LIFLCRNKDDFDKILIPPPYSVGVGTTDYIKGTEKAEEDFRRI
jgi:hypothetical protein